MFVLVLSLSHHSSVAVAQVNPRELYNTLPPPISLLERASQGGGTYGKLFFCRCFQSLLASPLKYGMRV